MVVRALARPFSPGHNAPLMRLLPAALLLLLVPARAGAEELTVLGDTPHASSRVTKRDLEERLPRSAPDALRWEPGVFVQQTGHGQGSPYIRGRTGQQTMLLFDGIRLNNSIYRQGPNQYLFTVDARSIRAIEVLRGGASTLYGSDAIGGVVHARPIEPSLSDADYRLFRPRAALRFGSADGEFAERFQLDAQLSPIVQVIAGVGFRRVGRLRSGGAVRSPTTGRVPEVPAFEDDGKTMLGTGFRELTTDVRAIVRTSETGRLVAAAYLYRQYDAPRTDQCPPAFAPHTECLVFEEQFRTLAYVAYEGMFGAAFPKSRIALSYQRQHERRRRDRPSVRVENSGRDDIDTFGVTATAESRALSAAPGWDLRAAFGGDVYFDSLRSSAWLRFTDLDLTRREQRGQYIDGSRYATGGVFSHLASTFAKKIIVRLGGRLGFSSASAPGDAASSSVAVDRTWLTHAAFLQGEWSATKALSIIGGYDRSFRAPNLDDLTSRQQTGPGFQLENAGLRPEIADTFEAGVRARTEVILAEAWVFRSIVHDAISRAVRGTSICPEATPQCGASATRYQLVNTPGASTIDGFEVALRARLPRDITLRATAAYAHGRGPNPQEPPSDPRLPYEQTVPLSRVAPFNGTFEARYAPTTWSWVGTGLRWATTQTRLAPSDRSDARIPEGGTPGFAVVDLRAGLRFDRHFVVTLIVENVTNAAYRYHGSSINGPGRSVLLALESGL